MRKRTGTNRTRGSGASEEAPDRATEPAESAEPEEPAGKRLGIQLGPDGRIEWDRLRDRTREELRTMLSDPRIASELGVHTGAAAAGGEQIPTSTVGMLYGALGSLMVGAATAMGYTAESAGVLQFTAEERATLLEPTAKVLSKYSGALGKYEDEILLCFALGSVIAPKVAALKKPGKVIAMAERAKPAEYVEPEPSDPTMVG